MFHRKLAMAASLLLAAALILSACAQSGTGTPSPEASTGTPTSTPTVTEPTPTDEATKEPAVGSTPTPTPTPIPCVPDPEKSTTWICLSVGRQIVFSAVPGGTAVRMFAPAAGLSDANKTGFEDFIYIAGDFRFYNIDTQAPVTDFSGHPVTIRLPLTADDQILLHKFSNVYLVQIDPDKKNIWKPLVARPSSSVEGPTIIFQFETWGVDPPTGLGVGN